MCTNGKNTGRADPRIQYLHVVKVRHGLWTGGLGIRVRPRSPADVLQVFPRAGLVTLDSFGRPNGLTILTLHRGLVPRPGG